MNNTKEREMESYKEYDVKGTTYRVYLEGKPSDWKDLMRAGWRPVMSLASGEFAGTRILEHFRNSRETPVYSK